MSSLHSLKIVKIGDWEIGYYPNIYGRRSLWHKCDAEANASVYVPGYTAYILDKCFWCREAIPEKVIVVALLMAENYETV